MDILNKKRPKILIRVDSSSQLGIGHLMRTMTLAKSLRDHFDLLFVTQELEGDRNEIIDREGFKRETLGSRSLYQVAHDHSPVLIIVDHYDMTLEEEQELSKEFQLFVFDDEFKNHACHIVLNHSFIATPSQYEGLVPCGTKVLAGARYTLLQEPFFHQSSKRSSTIKRVLVTLGGSDPLNLSFRVATFLKQCDKKLEVTIVTTRANKNLLWLKRRYKRVIVDEPSMATLMARYDLIVTSASSSLLETCALQKSFIALMCASNQEPTIEALKGLSTAIKRVSLATLKKGFLAVPYEKGKQRRLFQKYRFYKGEVAREILSLYGDLHNMGNTPILGR